MVRAEPSGGGDPSEGTLSFVDNAVDSSTGTILLKGRFPNDDGSLWPGGFVNVRLQLDVERDALVIPAAAVVSGQQGSFVFVIQPDSSASTKAVTVTRTAGDFAIVTGDVQPGDRVVVDGQLRSAPGVQSPDQSRRRHRAQAGGPMNTELFIRRPVMTTLVMAGILIFGLVAYRQLPVSDLPAVDYPSISVSASLPGASPETMASAVATPLEKQFSTIPGVETMTSTSTQGSTLHLAPVCAQPEHRRRRPGRAGRHLPGSAPAAPGHAAAELPEGGSVVVADSLLRVVAPPPCPCPSSTNTPKASWPSGSPPSTAWPRCRSIGSMKYAVRIQLDPQQLASRTIGIDEVGARRRQRGT